MMPSDPAILLSFVNTRLRDRYPDLEALCEDLDLDPAELAGKLDAIGYRYDPELRQFR